MGQVQYCNQSVFRSVSLSAQKAHVRDRRHYFTWCSEGLRIKDDAYDRLVYFAQYQ